MKIEREADVKNAHFEKWLSDIGEYKAYEYLLDNIPIAVFLEATKINGDIWDKIQYLKKEYYKCV